MEELKEKSIDFIYKIFANDCLNDNKLRYNSTYFNEVVELMYKQLTFQKIPVSNPYLIKFGGQSGSGKTTKLLPSITHNLRTDNYITIAVRTFAKSHPYYNQLLEEFGESLIREKTNGFALLCFFAVLKKLIENKFNILAEITLLDPDFEEYFIKLSKKYDYNVIYNVISISHKISNQWIEKRLKTSTNEKNRVVLAETSNYFYNILPKAIERIIKNKQYFDNKDYFVLWNIYDSKPILTTNIFNNDIITLFNKYRLIENNNFLTDKDSLKIKESFYSAFFQDKMIQNFFTERENLENIIKEELKDKNIIDIEKISTGWTNIVLNVKIDNEEEYIFRFPRNDFFASKIEKDVLANNFLKEKLGLKSVNMKLSYNKNRPFSIHKKIKGSALTQRINDLNSEKKDKIAKDIAEFFYTLHNIDINIIPEKNKETLSSFLTELSKVDTNYYDYSLLEELARDEKDNLVFVHGDLNIGNIILDKNDDIVAFIDFSFTGLSDIYCDLSRISCRIDKDFLDKILLYYEDFSKIKLDKNKIESRNKMWNYIEEQYVIYMKNNFPEIKL